MRVIIGYRGKTYQVSVIEIERHKHLYVNDCPVEHYPVDLQALAIQRAVSMGLM
jgi:hypothetical protein